MLNIIIFGPPGSGKGTQSVKIAEKFNLVHISTGFIIRNEIKSGSELGKLLKSIVDKGNFVPFKLIIKILDSILIKTKNANGYIFDGFPRTIEQAHYLDNILNKDNGSISLVLCLKVEDEILINRLLKRATIEGRKDDNEAVIKNRLQIYKSETYPLISWYKKQGKYNEIPGNKSINEIFEQVCKLINSKINDSIDHYDS
jgi:adenylate kinase